ncbi:MAG: hemolysin family protein [Synechococcaceae cyanobacterium]|nr:hemolysin family protein [Synechococcaceae cyanobacterium]
MRPPTQRRRSAVALEFLAILLLIVANGVFSGAEIAVVSSRKVRLEQRAQAGDRRARAALRLAGAPNEFLSTVQIGITLIGILSGAVGGATLSGRLRPLLAAVPLLRPWSEALSLVLVVAVITYLSLVIGELVPKRIALSAPEPVACALARPMAALSRLTAPLVHLLGHSTDALLHLLGVRASQEPEITEEEIKALIRQGAQSGVFEAAEHEIVQRVLRLADRPIKATMTPRTEIHWIDCEAPQEEQLRTVLDANHSRFPVGRGSLDDCLGVVRGRAFLAARLEQKPVDLEQLLQPPLYVAENARALAVIEQFKQSGVHIALVTDEYGGIEGLVTLNDLMEAIVGDLPSAEDEEDPLVIVREDGSWLLDGALDIGEFMDLVGRPHWSSAQTGGFHTLGGFAMHRLGRIPRAGEAFACDGLLFEIVDMDGNRVDKLLVRREPVAESADPA